jgi:hypothetical protein
MAAYSFLQFRANHVLIGGLFGIAIIASFGTWMVGELIESFVVTEENVENVEYINSSVMAGFSIFLIARFFWLRNVMPIEPKYVRS